jgi:hypothetical protein
MNDFENYEFVVRQKTEGVYRIKKVLFIILYVTFAVGLFSVGVGLRILAPCIAIVPLLLWILIFFTWRFTNVEHECVFESGIMRCAEIYGNRTRKLLFSATIRDMLLIAPETERNVSEAERYNVARVYKMTSSKNASGTYFAIFNDKDEKCAAVYFEANEKVLKILQFYNRSAIKK